MREIEIKLKVKNFNDLENRLKERECTLSEPIDQHDFIYSKGGNKQEWKSSKEGDFIIRIRHLKNKSELNLKQQRSGEMDNLEYETVIENPEAMHQILLTIGYTPEVEVKKIRRKGKLNGYEICLDQVERLGTFVELEKLTDDNVDPKYAREELLKELESLGLSRVDEELQGYDTQIYNLTKSK